MPSYNQLVGHDAPVKLDDSQDFKANLPNMEMNTMLVWKKIQELKKELGQDRTKITSILVGGPGAVDHSLLLNINSLNYYHLTQAQYNSLTGAANSILHFHDADRARANHTGTQLAATISDFTAAARLTISATAPITYNNVTGVIAGPATWAPTPHNVLSASHADSTAAACVLGDLIVGQAGPVWARYGLAVPVANVRNVLGVDNGETVPTWKAALDATLPATIAVGGAGQAGTSLVFSHRDHNHPAPATWAATAHNLLSATHGDTTAGVCVVGDLVVGVAGPQWSKLANVAVGSVLASTGITTGLSWSTSLGLTGTLCVGATTITGTGALAEIYSASANPIFSLVGLHANAYDPRLDFYTDSPATKKFSVGVDSTDDSFRIEVGTGALGARTDFVMSTIGNVGMGAGPQATSTLYLSKHSDDLGWAALEGDATIHTTATGVHSAQIFYLNAYGYQDSGQTNNGNITSIYSNAIKQGAGTLSGSLRSIWARYGMSAGAIIGSAIGIYIDPQFGDSGTLALSCDIYIYPRSGTVTPTNEWCLYSEHDVHSHLIGGFGLGGAAAYKTKVPLQSFNEAYTLNTLDRALVLSGGNDDVGGGGVSLAFNHVYGTPGVYLDTSATAGWMVGEIGCAYEGTHSYSSMMQFFTNAGAAVGNLVEQMRILHDGGILMPNLKSGATQVGSGAAAGELWKTASHATLPDNVIMVGV